MLLFTGGHYWDRLLNELTSQSVKSKTDSSSHESSGSNNNKDRNDSTDKGKKIGTTGEGKDSGNLW